MNSKKEINLHFPIQLDGKKINKLTMRRPTVRDRLLAAKDEGASPDEVEVKMFAILMDIPEENLHDMDLLDYEQCARAVNDFLKKPGSQSGT
ncbi:MAG: phage tail assembly protein [Endozoicomonas sp.]|uniref:phage tail assembly protein n=1 Tax=Endozoicomonas sp. TaxID=1892382 RepID=UPI003D9B7962